MSGIYKCGVCNFFTGLLRRFICVGNSRGSSDTCYRELGDQDTLRYDISSESIPTSKEDDDIIGLEEIYDVAKSEDISNKDECSSTPLVEESSSSGDSMSGLNKMRAIGSFHSFKKLPRKDFLPEDCYSLQVDLILANITAWEFDTHDLDRATGGHCLPVLGMDFFTGYDLIDYFSLSVEKCRKFFNLIQDNYHAKNPYHNSVHAADVTQAIHCFLQQPALLGHVTKLEIMVVLIAAMTHDLDHPGVNHGYLVATNHPLAIMFKEKELGINDHTPMRLPKRGKKHRRLNSMKRQLAAANGRDELPELAEEPALPVKAEKVAAKSTMKKQKIKEIVPCTSVLEHHHWRVAYSCILQSGIFNHMPKYLPRIQQLLKTLILATDITRQNHYLTIFEDHMRRKAIDMKLPDHRLMVLQMALKAADISNPGRPWPISKKWSSIVCEEFYKQGDEERKRNLEISNLCDRQKDSVAMIQIGFYRYIVMPLYLQWHYYLQSRLSQKMIHNLVVNEGEWAKEQQRSELTSNTDQSIITNADMVENSLETSTLLTDSSEMLIPPLPFALDMPDPVRKGRRSSYSPVKQIMTVRDVMRRSSTPLQMFTEPRPRSCGAKYDSVVNRREELDAQSAITSPDSVSTSKLDSFKHSSIYTKAMAITSNMYSPQEIENILSGSVMLRASPAPDDLEDSVSETDSDTESDTESHSASEEQDAFSPCHLEYEVQEKMDISDEDEQSSDEKVKIRLSSAPLASSSSTQTCASNQASNGHTYLLTSLSTNTASDPSSESRIYQGNESGVPESIKEVGDSLCVKPLPGGSVMTRRGSAPAVAALCDLRRLASNLSLHLGSPRKKRSASSCHQLMAVDIAPSTVLRRGSLPNVAITGVSAL